MEYGRQFGQVHSGVAAAPLTPTAVRELLDQQSTFLLLTVHELRGPLSLIGGYLAMIRDGSVALAPGSPTLDVAVTTMAGSVQAMAALIDGLAAVARHDDRSQALQRRLVWLGRIVGAAIDAVDLEARARQVGVEQLGVDARVEADLDLVSIALRNLLANAIHHSPRGSTVVVTLEETDTAATITVSDEGPGISPADAECVFDAWHRSGRSDGLGLGLWIVRRIVEWHGGRVTLESAPGRGSSFVIVLPRRGVARVSS